MKKIIFSIINLIFVVNINAQNFKFKSFGIGTNVSITNVILGKTDNFTQPKGTATTVESGLSYGLRLESAFSISKKVNLNVGASFNTLNFTQNVTGLKWGVDNDNGAYSPSITATKSNITTFNIPINGEFVLNKMQGLTIGIAPSFRMDKKGDLTITRISNNKVLDSFGSEFPVKSLNLIGSISFIQRIKLTNKINLKLEPILCIHLLGDELFVNYAKNNFYQYGLNLGLEFEQFSKNKASKKKVGG